MAIRLLRFLAATSFLLTMPIWSAFAENRGEYGRAEVEVDRSVLQDLQGYHPPPMFQRGDDNTSASPKIPPPDKVILTAPKTEDLLDHPVENHKVLTLQGSMVRDSAPPTSLPVPGEVKASLSSIPPLPPRKPSAGRTVAAAKAEVPKPTKMTAAELDDQGPLLPLPPPGVMASPGELSAKDAVSTQNVPMPAHKPANIGKAIVESQPTDAPNPSKYYRPSAPKTMPAVPPVKVEANPIPNMANLPPIDPEDRQRPTAGEIMMDDALTRHMVKSDKDVKEVLGMKDDVPSSEDMNQFSIAFKPTNIELNQDDRKLLDRTVIQRLSTDAKYRVLIRSYASRSDGTESSARRTSLSRALVVRSYLLSKGIQPTRIDVRALSDQTQEKPLDRIDMSLIAPNS